MNTNPNPERLNLSQPNACVAVMNTLGLEALHIHKYEEKEGKVIARNGEFSVTAEKVGENVAVTYQLGESTDRTNMQARLELKPNGEFVVNELFVRIDGERVYDPKASLTKNMESDDFYYTTGVDGVKAHGTSQRNALELVANALIYVSCARHSREAVHEVGVANAFRILDRLHLRDQIELEEVGIELAGDTRYSSKLPNGTEFEIALIDDGTPIREPHAVVTFYEPINKVNSLAFSLGGMYPGEQRENYVYEVDTVTILGHAKKNTYVKFASNVWIPFDFVVSYRNEIVRMDFSKDLLRSSARAAMGLQEKADYYQDLEILAAQLVKKQD